MNNQLTQDELGKYLRQIRFKLEIESYLQPHNDMWKLRFYQFLRCFVSDKKVPESLMLSDIIDHVINHPNHKLREYLNDLPGLYVGSEGAVKKMDISDETLRQHGYITMQAQQHSGNGICTTIKDFNIEWITDEIIYFDKKDRSLTIKLPPEKDTEESRLLIMETSDTHQKYLINTEINISNLLLYLAYYEDLYKIKAKDLKNMIEMIKI